MEPFEITVDGERWHIAERMPAGATPTYDLTWLSGPGGGQRGLTVGGGPLTREQLIREAAAYAASEG
ncbi:hypothetical protein DZG00_05650 [Clavibacter lycopersici]|uniref:Uncharacterized protein n=1 Tax=Clavibacter lycopersici TaxID=2301718 RepID=A0A399TBR8_9MICO|nr:hypothetical protein [Clavibacter lycopersici]RIJ52245.1 hypothetical protein DZG00_05650 [Clavibacter lycopersici]RIJ62225.1 hypothetical protein DZG02_02835 [Clavibacter lycopersici]